MDLCTESDKSEYIILSKITNDSFENGWISADEKVNIETKTKLIEKKAELYDILRNAKNNQYAIKLLEAIRCTKENYFLSPAVHLNDDEIIGISSERNSFSIEIDDGQDDFLMQVATNLDNENDSISRSQERQLLRKIPRKDISMLHVNETETTTLSHCNPLHRRKNPMELSLVISCIFGYLSLRDIKEFRLVSQAWNAAAKIFLRTRSSIHIHKHVNHFGNNNMPSRFYESFSEMLARFSFPAFIITGSRSSPWGLSELNQFFENEKSNIRELSLRGLLLLDENGEGMEDHNIESWISNSALVQPFLKQNTKLFASGSEDCLLQIPLHLLEHVKEIEIEYCQINVKDGAQLNPVKLVLDDVAFTDEDFNFSTIVCINDVADFSRAKVIKLVSSYSITEFSDTTTTLMIDLEGEISLDILDLCNISPCNWSTSKWRVKYFEFHGVPFKTQTKMQITELHFGESSIDLYVLPQSLEKLTITNIGHDYNDYGTKLSCSKPIVLRNLKYLYMELLKGASTSVIYHFVNFPQLVDMHLTFATETQLIQSPFAQYPIAIQFDWIPKTLKRLKLGNNITINPSFDDDNHSLNQLCLDKLILHNYSFDAIYKVCRNRIKVNDLVLVISTSKENDCILHLLENLRKSDTTKPKRVFIGYLCWGNYLCTFPSSPLASYVDKMDKCYVFENNIGKAIPLDDFNNLLEIS